MSEVFEPIRKILYVVALLLIVSLFLMYIAIYYHVLSPIMANAKQYYTSIVGTDIPNPLASGLPIFRTMFPIVMILVLVLLIVAVFLYKKKM